jgi:hypothetical protein
MREQGRAQSFEQRPPSMRQIRTYGLQGNSLAERRGGAKKWAAPVPPPFAHLEARGFASSVQPRATTTAPKQGK